MIFNVKVMKIYSILLVVQGEKKNILIKKKEYNRFDVEYNNSCRKHLLFEKTVNNGSTDGYNQPSCFD